MFLLHALCPQTVYHWQGVLVFKHPVDVVDNLSGVVVGDLTRPACPDALCTVHQHHWNDGNVPLRFHLLVVVEQELEQVGVHCWEQKLGKRTVGKETVIMGLTISSTHTFKFISTLEFSDASSVKSIRIFRFREYKHWYLQQE